MNSDALILSLIAFLGAVGFVSAPASAFFFGRADAFRQMKRTSSSDNETNRALADQRPEMK